ncbi:glycosyltransferase family 2 protein [Sphingomicrobium astaxanthinifaciens]|uniref:glycosyltransferase family 2 protein n=1 Tax=Sphingomicrobium astaxanthinifaciens TaxID=1227949 RepID=UPI001FCA5DA2|nr:glycosyltransferase family 2 protein [Sphingomicrobium astaxanthinifaciens]MCJ7421299.1 glycosyltransferase family 2 protein [Sphingomicrobium astaxanthinifaciens]
MNMMIQIASPELTLLVPVKDEEAAIPAFLATVMPILEALDDPAGKSFEILFIDDGSSDATLTLIRDAAARDPRVRGLSLSRNFGKEAALTAGIDHARGKAVIPYDVDMQDPPSALAPMLAKWREGHEVVVGVREDRKSDGMLKRWTASAYYRTHNALSKDKILEHAGDFRLLDRKVVDVIKALPERNRFMKGLFGWAGFKTATVTYAREERENGTTKFGFWKLWTLALDGITSASTVPLRVWSYVGGLVALGTLAYATLIVIRTLVTGVDVPGYASIMVAVLFLGSVQLISLGILGEYVGRILTETKQRPLYVVAEKIGDRE